MPSAVMVRHPEICKPFYRLFQTMDELDWGMVSPDRNGFYLKIASGDVFPLVFCPFCGGKL